jgi:hypothetical protein
MMSTITESPDVEDAITPEISLIHAGVLKIWPLECMGNTRISRVPAARLCRSAAPSTD